MRLTVLRMLSTSSLQAFSSATTTPIDRAAPANPVRLVRATPDQPARASAAPTLPTGFPPSVPPPRGSLLNLSV